ncbi:hypothetical protein D3C72_1091550 [compost metagenome]
MRSALEYFLDIPPDILVYGDCPFQKTLWGPFGEKAVGSGQMFFIGSIGMWDSHTPVKGDPFIIVEYLYRRP